MECDFGSEKLQLKETWQDRWEERKARFLNDFGFAIGPMIFVVGTAVTLLAMKFSGH